MAKSKTTQVIEAIDGAKQTINLLERAARKYGVIDKSTKGRKRKDKPKIRSGK